MAEELSPLGQIVAGLALLSAGVLLGRHALRQRARWRSKPDNEVGSLDGMFDRHYQGEPKLSRANEISNPASWFIAMAGAVILALTGAATLAAGLARMSGLGNALA